ncbi:MAG: hypothetical protein JSR93_09740, partial [Verrucomicrobia bacterium]|nr:hypothetical protein [Verrucomicrobiota bacterium]
FEQHKDYIMHEVLGTQVIFECSNGTQWDLNGEPTTIGIALSVASTP